MTHSDMELIEDPQWVSYCVEAECSFADHIRGGYVCQKHCSRHSCTGSACSLVRLMATRARYRTSSSESPCPVTDLLAFHKPRLEFRGPYCVPHQGDSAEVGYGATEHRVGSTRLSCSEAEIGQLILKASLPVLIALFSTTLTEEFRLQYEMVDKTLGFHTSSNAPSSAYSWMADIFELAESIRFNPRPELRCSREMAAVVRDAVLKCAAGVATLFDSRDRMVARFMKSVACKYNDKEAKRADFYTAVVMLALCLFPYLKLGTLGELFNNRTLVIMCFDKTRTRHSQWSRLSTHIHRHVNQPEFVERVLRNTDLCSSLPVVVTVTLEEYISDADYCDNSDEIAMSHCDTPRPHRRHVGNLTAESRHSTLQLIVEEDGKKQNDQRPARKRNTPCSAGFYETDEGRLEEKRMRLQ